MSFQEIKSEDQVPSLRLCELSFVRRI